jgi:predicted phosphodiesterase
MRILYLGDIHGKFYLIENYIEIYDIKDAHIIQVGDFGVGFTTMDKDKKNLSDLNQTLIKNNVIVWAIRGNHDFKPYFDNDPFGLSNIHLVKDYTVLNLEGKNILCIGGAVSVDRSYRKTSNQLKGIYDECDRADGFHTWWPDEIFFLDMKNISEMRDINVVVTHTCPDYCPPNNIFEFNSFVEGIIRETGDTNLKVDLLYERNQLTNAFSILKMNNNIDNHYYGHFHMSDIVNINGTKHRLLGVGELFEDRE